MGKRKTNELATSISYSPKVLGLKSINLNWKGETNDQLAGGCLLSGLSSHLGGILSRMDGLNSRWNEVGTLPLCDEGKHGRT